MRNLITFLLQISTRLLHWKNFENRPVFDEVMPKISLLLVRFFSDTVYISHARCDLSRSTSLSDTYERFGISVVSIHCHKLPSLFDDSCSIDERGDW